MLRTTARYWHVQYRALVPKGVGNLLVAGRCIGGDKISHASARNMMCCAVSGQGAGTAAAVSLQRDEALDQVNIGAVQAVLSRQGARLRWRQPRPGPGRAATAGTYGGAGWCSCRRQYPNSP